MCARQACCIGRILMSPHASAQVVSIDTSAAEKMEGVKAVVSFGNQEVTL